MNEKEITIKVPEGKRAEWINGILTLVDEPKKDNRPVTERIKTLEDACNELGDKHPFVKQYRFIAAAYKSDPMAKDFIAYLKLRIINAALNEGWEPQFTKYERRWFFLYNLITKEEYDKLPNEDKGRCVGRSDSSADAFGGLSYAYAGAGFSPSYSSNGARLAFRTRELAEYASRQFTQEFSDFVFKPEDRRA